MDAISSANKSDEPSAKDANSSSGDRRPPELSHDELLRLLSCLEGKLEASEVAIAALKTDRLKRLFYPSLIRRHTNVNNKKLNRNSSLNYATIIPSGRQQPGTQENQKDAKTSQPSPSAESRPAISETNLDDLDEFGRDLDEEISDIKSDSLFPHDKYNDYRRGLDTNPYLALAGDLKYAYDHESSESLIAKVYNGRVLRVKQLVQQQQDARRFLESQLDELSTRYKDVVDELEVEKEKNVRFQRDEIVKKLERTEREKKELEDELAALKKEFETEKEREKVMIVYLLSERKQLIVRLIEESEKNTELVNLLSSEKNRSSEIEEGLEEESKRSLQMEIDLECLTNKYETEKSKAEERVRELEKQNSVLQSECDRVKQKLNDLLNSTGSTTNNNNLITNNKNLPCDLGEGVRSTIVTFNNAIASMASSTVANSCQQPRPNLVQSLQTKPSLAAKPSFDGSSTNGKVTIISTTGPSLQSGGGGAKSNEPPVNNVNSSTSSPTTTTCTSVASVVQKFTEFSNTISNNIPSHQPIVKKLSSSGLVANIAQGIVGGQQTTTGSTRGKPPPVPSKPVINSQLLKERTAKMMLEQNSQQFTN